MYTRCWSDPFLPWHDPAHPVYATLSPCEQLQCELARLQALSVLPSQYAKLRRVDSFIDIEWPYTQVACRNNQPELYLDTLSITQKAAVLIAIQAHQKNQDLPDGAAWLSQYLSAGQFQAAEESLVEILRKTENTTEKSCSIADVAEDQILFDAMRVLMLDHHPHDPNQPTDCDQLISNLSEQSEILESTASDSLRIALPDVARAHHEETGSPCEHVNPRASIDSICWLWSPYSWHVVSKLDDQGIEHRIEELCRSWSSWFHKVQDQSTEWPTSPLARPLQLAMRSKDIELIELRLHQRIRATGSMKDPGFRTRFTPRRQR